MAQGSHSARKLFTTLLLLLILGGLGYGSFLYFRDTTPPTLSLTPLSGAVSENTVFKITASDPSGLRSVTLQARDNATTIQLLAVQPGGQTSYSGNFTLPTKKLYDGGLVLALNAVDASYYNIGKGNSATVSQQYILDTRKPRINLLTVTHNINRGGTNLVLYSVDEPAAKSGVQVGDNFFPGYKMPNGKYGCFFAFPYFVELKDFNPRLIAEDAAGNTRVMGIPHHANDRKYRQDQIHLPDSFLDRKMPQFEQDFPDEKSPLGIFLRVNRELRVKNRARLHDIGRKTAHQPLWKGRFLRLTNAKTMAGFGDQRDYIYKGKKVDHQTHLGIDLASVRHAKVEAANKGEVVFTGFFGIYGNCIIIDHGMGLQTLYSHLSQIDVEPGQQVQRGEVIARTGATGMAGGDHLHFGVILSGIPVNPKEWWDETWINNNIAGKLEALGQ
ncbi:MAG: M23 family metallopeptidase [Desulfovibrio sp.]|uniref:M23 family metallopeptidase n=1 Tax=Desulfovibrio sp. 7SRBS1 TaxID=3378064 RepID=UPI003B3CC3B3